MTRPKKVLVAMSGGLDSSLAAALLKKQGYDVIGATMKLRPEEECGKDKRAELRCPLSGIEDARAVAVRIGIPHYVFDFSKEFKTNVIDYFCDAYSRGGTPNPCILCNQKLKFGLLLEKALDLGCEHIATGHYAKAGYNRISRRYYIREGKDKAKDQSYFLAFVSQDALKRAIFPLGGITKRKARLLAKKMGLKAHDKASSQEICFIDEHYVNYLQSKGAIKTGEGDILDTSGKKIGRHKGIHYYTIGQRRGLGIAYKEPLYVIGIDTEKNAIIAGTKEAVTKRVFIAQEPNWIGASGLAKPSRLFVKIRYGHKKSKALVEMLNNDELKITFEKPQEAITPGQAAVLYKQDVVMGGAWIAKVLG